MNKLNLKVNQTLLNELAKKKFIKMTNDETLWEKTYKSYIEYMDPKCIFAVAEDISTDQNNLIIDGVSITSDAFLTIPEEILGKVAIFATTIGEIPAKSDSILDSGLKDIIGTAYIDALKDLLRMELEEDFIVGGLLAPGLEKMPMEEITKFNKLLNFEDIGIELNDSYTMIPEKSYSGLFLLFSESHPVNTNSCETCMARGHGCNFCGGSEKSNV